MWFNQLTHHMCNQLITDTENKPSAAQEAEVSLDTESLHCRAINPHQGHEEHENFVRWLSALRRSQLRPA